MSVQNPAATQLFYDSFDEADPECTSDPSVYVSASTSFSEAFMEHDARGNVTVEAISDVPTGEKPKYSSETHTSPQAIGSGLKGSFWANPQGSSNVNMDDFSTGGRNMKMSLCNSHPKAPRPSGGSLGLWVQYKPGLTAQDLYRKVVIPGLKPSCSLSWVLEQVRGGLVVEALLVNTINITGTKSAVISFLKEHSAMAYVEYVNNHLCEIDGKKVTASLVSTPSWPLSLALKRAIREKHHTRCLEIQDFPRDVSSSTLRGDLEIDPAIKLDAIEHMAMDSNGIATLRFCSVRAAQQASGHLSSHPKYRGCRLEYAADPCTLPLSQVN